jgi:hypothetical protein
MLRIFSFPILLMGLFFFGAFLYVLPKKMAQFVVISLLLVCISFCFYIKINKQIEVSKKDVYGKYIVDQTKYSKKQAAWQYETFNIEITRDKLIEADFLTLFVLAKGKIVNIYRRKIEFIDVYKNRWRFETENDTTTHHIISSTPTLFRHVGYFNYVFESSRFGNVFFRKK